jgi:hypothetical protein
MLTNSCELFASTANTDEDRHHRRPKFQRVDYTKKAKHKYIGIT